MALLTAIKQQNIPLVIKPSPQPSKTCKSSVASVLLVQQGHKIPLAKQRASTGRGVLDSGPLLPENVTHAIFEKLPNGEGVPMGRALCVMLVGSIMPNSCVSARRLIQRDKRLV